MIIDKLNHSVKRYAMKDLTKGNIYKTFILFAIPMILANFLSQAYSTINVIMAGKLLGDGALGATGALSPFNTFINSIFWGYGMGLGIYVSHLFGAKDFVKIKSVIFSNFSLLSGILLVLSAVFLIFRYQIYAIFKVDPLILAECDRYFIIITLGRVFILFVANCVPVFNAIGDSAFPLYLSFLSATLNIAVGALAITVFGMGVEGLALGTVVAAIIITVIYLIKLSSVFKKMNVHSVKTPFTFSTIRETGGLAVSTMIQQSIMYFAGLLLSPMINGISGAASASYTVTLRIHDINASIYINSSKTVGSYTAQCYGAKKYHLIKKGLRVGILQSLLLVCPFILGCSLFATNVVALFYESNADPVAVGYTVTFLQYCLPFLVINVFANLFHNFFRGIGKMRLLLATTVTGSIARIIISALLIGPLGIYGYYVGWVLYWFVDAAVGAGLYFFGSWRKEIT